MKTERDTSFRYFPWDIALASGVPLILPCLTIQFELGLSSPPWMAYTFGGNLRRVYTRLPEIKLQSAYHEY